MLRISIAIVLLLITTPNGIADEATDPAQAIVHHMLSQEFRQKFSDNLTKAQKQIQTQRQKTDIRQKENIRRVQPIVDESENIFRQTVQKKASQPKEKMLIFLSESMPDHEIWRFLAGGVRLTPFKTVKFIMNGFPQKGIIDQYAEKHQQNILLSIDPFLFEEHEIESVPVVILGEYRVDTPLNLSEVLDLIEKKSGIDLSDMKYVLQLP